MHRDYVNPLLLLVVVLLLACRVARETPEAASRLTVWLLVLCVTALTVNAALAVARVLSRRRALMSVVWTVVFLILASCVLVVPGMGREEGADAFQRLAEEYRLSDNPQVRDGEGNSLLALAAAHGKVSLVQELLEKGSALPLSMREEAAMRAAEGNHREVLQLLLDSGVAVDGVMGGSSLLAAAAQFGRVDTMELLLQRGADPNRRDEEGFTPLMHAVLSDFVPAVRLLMRHGADSSLLNGEGRNAASYSRRAEMDQALAAPRP